MSQEIKEAEDKFHEDHREEIEAARNQQQNKDEQENEEPSEKQPVLVIPVFNVQEFQVKWLLENPIIDIPEDIVEDIDNDCTF